MDTIGGAFMLGARIERWTVGVELGEIGASGVLFDASRCSLVYGSSPTVMPPSINTPYAIYLGLTV